MKKKISSTRLGWYIILGIVVVVFIFSFFNKSNIPTTTSQKGIVHNSEYDGSVSQAERYLKDHLKDPSSYESVEWYKVVEVNGYSEDYPNAKYTVRHKYRAKNSFGALDLSLSVFFIDEQGNILGMKNIN